MVGQIVVQNVSAQRLLSSSGVRNIRLWENFTDKNSEYLSLFLFCIEGKGIEGTKLLLLLWQG